MNMLEKLSFFLRPPGKGVYAVSTGRKMADALLKRIYGTSQLSLMDTRWKQNLKNIPAATVVLLGCPSDTGAGIVRGSNMGPLALRQILYRHKKFVGWVRQREVVDIGDIAVIPQLLDDEMLSPRQIEKSRRHLYGQQRPWPVSPLSLLREVGRLLIALNPNLKIMLLGGDHSLSWPMVQTYHPVKKPFSIVHVDAHTDLLESRLGIDHCFGTWAHHANQLIGKKQRLVQVGIRASGKPQSHWESACQVKQFWAADIQKNPKKSFEQIMTHLTSLNLQRVYISNDIDGTGMEYAAATGTPEPKGLHPTFVSKLIRQIGQTFDVIGSDLVEVAPVLGLNRPGEPEKTLKIGCQYTLDMIDAMLSARP